MAGGGGFVFVISPSSSSIGVGDTQQYSAYYLGTDYTNDSRTSWAVCDTSMHTTPASSHASVTNTPGTKGLVTGAAAGSTYVSAMWTVGEYVVGFGETPLTVTAPVLTSIEVTPADESLKKGTTQQFTATGTYSNGSTQDITQQVTWASSNHAIATIT